MSACRPARALVTTGTERPLRDSPQTCSEGPPLPAISRDGLLPPASLASVAVERVGSISAPSHSGRATVIEADLQRHIAGVIVGIARRVALTLGSWRKHRVRCVTLHYH